MNERKQQAQEIKKQKTEVFVPDPSDPQSLERNKVINRSEAARKGTQTRAKYEKEFKAHQDAARTLLLLQTTPLERPLSSTSTTTDSRSRGVLTIHELTEGKTR